MTKKRQRLAPLPRVTSKTITVGALLRKIKRLILTEPKRLNMERWLVAFKGSKVHARLDFIDPKPACGTVGCMAGWAAILMRPDITSGKRLDLKAERVIEHAVGYVRDDGARSVGGLFFPSPIQDEDHLGVPGTADHADVIAKRIDTYLSQHPEIVHRKIIVADVQKALRA